MAESSPDIKLVTVTTPHCGELRAYVQGSLEDRNRKTVFLTCHDIGSNHTSWYPFTLHHPSMNDVRAKSVFIHMCIPGQEEKAPNLPDNFVFPSLDDIASDLKLVLDHLKVKTVIAVGEGAGANIIVRFALHNPNSVLGLVLIHPTSSAAGVMEYIGNKFMNWKMEKSAGMNQMAYDYLVYHKFGLNASTGDDKVSKYLKDVQENLNQRNLYHFVDAFIKRTEIQSLLSEKLKLDALLLVGAKASHLEWVYDMHQAMNKIGTTLLVVDDVVDVLTDSPDKVSRALILFCKGCGSLSGVGIPGMERLRTLSGSMEEADKPRRLSLGGGKLSMSPPKE